MLPPSEMSEMHPDVCSGDLGRVIKLKSERNLRDDEKFYLLKYHFVPAKGYKFPNCTFNAQKQQFQMGWLNKYNGLIYSQSQDGGYCLFCVLFGQCEPSELEVLLNRSLTKFKNAIEKLNEHFVSKGRNPIVKLRSIAATVIFCGRQALAFRGHHEDRFEVSSDKPMRRGNFQFLLLFRIDAGDEVLKEHLFTCGHNATYVSKEIQNQIIHIMWKYYP